MTFYINEVPSRNESDWHHRCIGLFTNNEFKGEGSCCGWYGAEYYLNTDLLAMGIQLVDGGSPIKFRHPFDGGFRIFENQHYDKIHIGSCMFEEEFEANSVEEAIDIFRRQQWLRVRK